MAIPSSDHPAWKKVITGEIDITSPKLAVNMLIHNCRVKYKKDSSDDNLATLTGYIFAVFNKYGAVYSAELQQIFR